MEIFTSDKKVQQRLDRLEYQELLDYFRRLQEPVILREIRKNFPEHKHLDKDLEFLIEQGIVSRIERRYKLSVPLLTNYPTDEKVNAFVHESNNQYSPEELLVWLGEEVWSDQLRSTVAVDFPLAKRNCLENEAFRLVTINQGGTLTETLPNYFETIEQPTLFPTLAPLIGDVNLEFFMNQITLILERVLAMKAPRRKSIFLESLVTSQLIAEQPDWHVSIPVYEESFSLPQLPKEQNETAFFFSRQLAERLLGDQASFTYLIKKKA